MLDKKTLSERDICTKFITPAMEVFDEENISQKVTKLDASFWARAKDLIPAEWMNEDHFRRIRNHTARVQDHIHQFVQDMQKLVL